MAMVPEGGGRSDLPKEELTKSIYSGTWGRIVKDDITVTITTRFDTPSSGRFTHPFLNRALFLTHLILMSLIYWLNPMKRTSYNSFTKF